MAANDDFILELLIKHGLIQPSDLEDARRAASNNGHGPVEELVRRGLVTEMDILRTTAAEAGVDLLEKIDAVPEEAVKAVPQQLAYRLSVMPLNLEGRHLRVALTDPFNFDTIDTLSKEVRYEVDLVVAPAEQIAHALKRHYGSASDMVHSLIGSYSGDDLQVKDGRKLEGEEEDRQAGDDAHIIRLVNLMILEAHRLRASDIHLEPLEKRLRLRYRIDGMLHVMTDPPKKLQAAMVSRIKIMSNMSIAEKRLPQDGRIQMRASDGRTSIDLRVSSIPTNHGESIVMRILDKSSLVLGLTELGFLSDDQVTMERILALPDGIFLVTGPTGSGKSTTLYACLNMINKPDRKIITVEDPVEYQLNGINQVPVNVEVGMTFPAALRAMLRQAPNIIMVGEIRDLETASIAINASLTGHLVFSTLHTNDAPSAVTRLVDIGVKKFLVASSVRAIMAQRLVRRICSNCTEPYTPTEPELRALNLKPDQIAQANFRRGHGCDKCRGTGYRGRMGIFEICVLDDEIRRMVNEGLSVTLIRQRARDLGMRTLREDGVRKVLGGLTTPDEVITATMGDKE
ncbi:MAG: Flp pilus assembly complex ATPase component TadA [Methylacidiphilales bacterium]|nr:Flp pilus assembly complex ATPase component TadA [Candidatus Methylacidiphilales bacterium]